MIEITIRHYLILCPLIFLAGFIDSIAGGGGLISLPAHMLIGLDSNFAIGTNKLSACMGSTVSTAKYAKNSYVPYLTAICCAAASFLGADCGSSLKLLVSDRVFKIFMLCALPVVAYIILTKHPLEEKREAFSVRKTILIGVPISFVIGCYDGFYGPGTGTFLILALSAFAHMDLKSAQGTAKMVNWASNLSSVFVFWKADKIVFPLAIAAGLFGMAGNYIGATLFSKKDAKIVKPMMLVVLAIFFVKVILELLGIM